MPRLRSLLLVVVPMLFVSGVIAALSAAGGSTVDVRASGATEPVPAYLSVPEWPILPTSSSSTTQPPTTTTTQPPTTTTPPTTQAPPPPPAPVAPSGNCGGWEGLIAAYFPASQVPKACDVMLCESNGNPSAVSPTNDHGLFQINRHWNEANWTRVTGQPWSAVYDPDTNTRFAAWLFGQRGWQPWACA